MHLISSLPAEWVVIFVRVTGIDSVHFRDATIEFWNCSDVVVFFVNIHNRFITYL